MLATLAIVAIVCVCRQRAGACMRRAAASQTIPVCCRLWPRRFLSLAELDAAAETVDARGVAQATGSSMTTTSSRTAGERGSPRQPRDKGLAPGGEFTDVELTEVELAAPSVLAGEVRLY